MSAPSIKINYLDGNYPIQAEGTIAGKPFYFGARGEHWVLDIGVDAVGAPEWEHSEWFANWPAAQLMTKEQAKALLQKAARRYADGLPGLHVGKPVGWDEWDQERLIRAMQIVADPNEAAEKKGAQVISFKRDIGEL